jgi:hypothetical protein
VRARIEAARGALAGGHAAAAVAQAEQALASEPDDPRLNLLRARCLAARGDQAAAVDLLVEAVRRNSGAAGPYLHAAEMAWSLGHRDDAMGVLDGVQTRLRLLTPILGVVQRHGAPHLDPHAGFELMSSLPPLVVTFRLICRNPAPTPERPIRVVLTLDRVVVAIGELIGLGATLALEVRVPTHPSAARLDLRWTGAIDLLPAPTDDPLAVRLVGADIRLL